MGQTQPSTPAQRPRARRAGVVTGILRPGPLDAITDVEGVLVGHTTVSEGDDVRTGVTVIRPHPRNAFQEKVPAAVAVANGFGKLVGDLPGRGTGRPRDPHRPHRDAERLAGGGRARRSGSSRFPATAIALSVNPVVGECNDGFLSDIRRRPVGPGHVAAALESASGGEVAEGCVGAGTGCCCLGWKGGIGTASRRVPPSLGGWTVGVLAQTNFNFGGVLTVAGIPVGVELGRHGFRDELANPENGSCMVVVATDAPLDARQLGRVARRVPMGLARAGSFASNGSGDYGIAFSTNRSCVARHEAPGLRRVELLPDEDLSQLFLATVEATEEAVLNSLFAATTTRGFMGHTVDALPIDRVVEILRRHRMLGPEGR